MRAFKTSFVILVVTLMGVAGVRFDAQSSRPGEKLRVIPYKRGISIADRLLPNDDAVEVQKSSFPSLRAIREPGTFDEALDDAREHGAIIVARGLRNGGTLFPDGSWIRGKVTGAIVEAVKISPDFQEAHGVVTFSHEDGELFIGRVRVRAGVYPVFSPESRYLLLLNYSPTFGWYLGSALSVDNQGTLGGIMLSNGEHRIYTPGLNALSLTKVVDGLKRTK